MRQHRAVAILHSRNIGEKKEMVSRPAGRAGDGHLVGIDVIDVALFVSRYAGDHREVPGRCDRFEETAFGPGWLTDGSEVRVKLDRVSEGAIETRKPDARSSRGNEGRDQLLVNASPQSP